MISSQVKCTHYPLDTQYWIVQTSLFCSITKKDKFFIYILSSSKLSINTIFYPPCHFLVVNDFCIINYISQKSLYTKEESLRCSFNTNYGLICFLVYGNTSPWYKRRSSRYLVFISDFSYTQFLHLVLKGTTTEVESLYWGVSCDLDWFNVGS